MKYFIIDKAVYLNSPDEIIFAFWATGPTTDTTWKIDYYRCFNCHIFHPFAANAVDPIFLKQVITFLKIFSPTKVGHLQYPTYVGLTSGFCTCTFGSNNQNRYLWKLWKKVSLKRDQPISRHGESRVRILSLFPWLKYQRSVEKIAMLLTVGNIGFTRITITNGARSFY